MTIMSRTIAVGAATALLAGGLAAPAQAATMKYDAATQKCTFTYTDDDHKRFPSFFIGPGNETFTIAQAKERLAMYRDNVEVSKGYLNIKKKNGTPEEIADAQAIYDGDVTNLKIAELVFNACINKTSANTDSLPSPGGSSDDLSSDGSSDDQSSDIDDSTKNGLIAAGVIAAIVGLIAAAAPHVKHMLPANIAKLLP